MVPGCLAISCLQKMRQICSFFVKSNLYSIQRHFDWVSRLGVEVIYCIFIYCEMPNVNRRHPSVADKRWENGFVWWRHAHDVYAELNANGSLYSPRANMYKWMSSQWISWIANRKRIHEFSVVMECTARERLELMNEFVAKRFCR